MSEPKIVERKRGDELAVGRHTGVGVVDEALPADVFTAPDGGGVTLNGFEAVTSSCPLVQSVFRPDLPLPPLAAEHLKQFPFEAPANVAECSVWYEGTFDPLGRHHEEILTRTVGLGFRRATLAIVMQNPYKPESTPFEDRAEMARRQVEAAGFTVVDDPRKPGICIITSPEAFHYHRMLALFDRNTYILIGPDNFEKALKTNILWVHPEQIRENPAAADYFGFRSLYHNVPGFRRTVLVWPQLHDVHSTDIREGRVAAPPMVEKYAHEKRLYVPRAQAVAPKPAAAIGLVDDQSRLTRAGEAVLLRHQIEGTVGINLARLGVFPEHVRDALYRKLGTFDWSELCEAKAALDEATRVTAADRAVAEQPESPDVIQLQPRMHQPAVSTISKLRGSVMKALIGRDLQCSGSEHVHQAVQQGQKIFFIGNSSGWADPALLSLALSIEGAGTVAKRLSFIMPSEMFPTKFVDLLFGRSVARIPLTPQATNDDQRPLESAVRHAVRRLTRDEDKAAAFFPEGSGSQNGLMLFGHAFVSALQQHEPSLEAVDSEVVIMPWAQRGGADFVRGSVDLSEETPPMVRFGEALPVRLLLTLARDESPEIAAHVVGHLVARLVPPEHRGVYGSYAERYLNHPEPHHRVSERDLAAITRAAEIVKLLDSRGESQTAGENDGLGASFVRTA